MKSVNIWKVSMRPVNGHFSNDQSTMLQIMSSKKSI